MRGPIAPAAPPAGYELFPWRERLLRAHAEAKYQSFCFELDAHVFPSLGHREGCRRLMSEITGRKGFVEEATWLIGHRKSAGAKIEFCGTIQGIRDSRGAGWVQNVGVTPAHRDRGLGAVIVRRSLAGFHAAGIRRVYLEVTSQNTAAYRLYRRLGFRTVKTVYKAVEFEYA